MCNYSLIHKKIPGLCWTTLDQTHTPPRSAGRRPAVSPIGNRQPYGHTTPRPRASALFLSRPEAKPGERAWCVLSSWHLISQFVFQRSGVTRLPKIRTGALSRGLTPPEQKKFLFSPSKIEIPNEYGPLMPFKTPFKHPLKPLLKGILEVNLRALSPIIALSRPVAGAGTASSPI